MNPYDAFFRDITGYERAPFQFRVQSVLSNGRNVVLQAPTGAGKTWAAVVPPLFARSINQPIADRVLYALPLRSLATSLYESTRRAVESCASLSSRRPAVSIQTGESPNDPKFEADIVFTTIDQLLSSYLQHPVGLPDRCGNINAGAIPGALVVFDEFHLLDTARSMGTAIEMLQTFWRDQQLTQFVVMTATLSQRSLEWLSRELRAEIVSVPSDELAQLYNERGRERTYEFVPEPLTTDGVIRFHGGARSIVIVNSVTRAQMLYRELSGASARERLGSGVEVRLLHSRFFTEDRRRIEADLADWFGPKAHRTNIVLVSTQTIEAGMDFSCENLHTELAPLNSLVQRAGRCARRRSELGRVRVYELLNNDRGEPQYGPYSDDRAIVEATREALTTVVGSPKRFSFLDELDLIDRVHTGPESEQLKSYANIYSRRKLVRQAMVEASNARLRELIRDINNVNVVLTDRPEQLRFDGPEWPELLSIPSLSLVSLVRETNKGGWAIKAARDADIEGNTLRFDWVPCHEKKEVGEAWLLALHPSVACYTTDLGLELGTEGQPLVRMRPRKAIHRYSYKMELYSEHVENVIASGMKLEPSCEIATRRFAVIYGVEPGRVTEWLRWIWTFHDVGKLSVEWQMAIWDWQNKKTPCAEKSRLPLAHSDYNPATDFELQKKAPQRPSHAAEGAYAVANLLLQRIGCEQQDICEVARAAITAIATHHGPRTALRRQFRLIANANAAVAETLAEHSAEVGLATPTTPNDIDSFVEEQFSPASPRSLKHLPIYLYFCRRLRLADQGSFEGD